MVTEFFYPRCGGVEMHVLSLCKTLLSMNYHVLLYTANKQVIVITRYDDNHIGYELLDDTLPVYYLPLEDMTMGTVFPYFFVWMPMLRRVVDYVRTSLSDTPKRTHRHSPFSSVHECHVLYLRSSV